MFSCWPRPHSVKLNKIWKREPRWWGDSRTKMVFLHPEKLVDSLFLCLSWSTGWNSMHISRGQLFLKMRSFQLYLNYIYCNEEASSKFSPSKPCHYPLKKLISDLFNLASLVITNWPTWPLFDFLQKIFCSKLNIRKLTSEFSKIFGWRHLQIGEES